MISGNFIQSLWVVMGLVLEAKALASTQFKSVRKHFYSSPDLMIGSMLLPVYERKHTLTIPDHILRQRVEKSKDDETIEPLSISTPTTLAGINAIVEKIARPGRETKVLRYIQVELKNNQEGNHDKKIAQIPISPKIFSLIDPMQYSDLFSKQHSQLEVDGSKLKKDAALRNQLMAQVRNFLSEEDLYRFKEQVKKGEKISVDQYLLPEFARKMVKKFILYRGPNCFHAALAFQNFNLSRSPFVNVKEEKGYHRAMINYDELWAILNRSFYEVDLAQESLKYGDMIVFFDVPKTFTSSEVPTEIDYRWIRHTTTFLFNGYTFAKGSKSPNTPYAVRSLADEWDVWSKYSKNLGAKVYRKANHGDSLQMPFDLQDWLL